MSQKNQLNELRRLAGLTESFDLDQGSDEPQHDQPTRYEENGKTIIELGDGVMRDEEWHERFIEAAAGKGFVNGKDFVVHIARGDEVPHAITVVNAAVLQDPELSQELDSMEGPSPY